MSADESTADRAAASARDDRQTAGDEGTGTKIRPGTPTASGATATAAAEPPPGAKAPGAKAPGAGAPGGGVADRVAENGAPTAGADRPGPGKDKAEAGTAKAGAADADAADADAADTGAAPPAPSATGARAEAGATEAGAIETGAAKPGEADAEAATKVDTKADTKADATAVQPAVGAAAPAGTAAAVARPSLLRRLLPARRRTATPVGADEPAAATDPWQRFAPAQEQVPGRVRRALNAVGRVLVHEWTLAALGSVLLAVLMTWPTLRYPEYTIPQDVWDPTLQAWQMAWSGHILMLDVTQLWHSNAFFPERFSFTFSDTLLGYAPAGLIGEGPEAAILRYNIMFVFAHALALFGAYVLVRQLGAGRTAAAVAGVAFAYAPWRLAQAGHLHILSSGGIVLALAMIARGHGWSLRPGKRPARRRPGWALAGWLVATWQLTLGFGIGLPFAYVLGGIAAVTALGWLIRLALRRPRRPFGVRLLLADLFGGLSFAAVGVLMSLPYFRVADLHPYAKRSIDELRIYSVPLKGFLIAPEESLIWGDLHESAREGLRWPPEMAILPGFVLLALALAGLFISIWRVHHRLLLLAGVIVTVALGMGTQFFGGEAGYLLLFKHAPGWQGLRTPGRFVLWTTLLLGILAAGAVGALIQSAHDSRREPAVANRLGFWLRLATLLPLVLVAVEGLNRTPHPVVPRQPEAMRTAQSPLLVLPSDERIDNNVMLWSTDRFEPIVNGNSGFVPNRLRDVREVTATFPDLQSIDYLRELGVRTVILLPAKAAGTPWERAAATPVDGLGITREEVGEAIVYRLNG